MSAAFTPERGKFQDPDRTAKGEPRAKIAMKGLTTLWFNTGTLCNIKCNNCYIESSPTNDRLEYLSVHDVTAYLDEAANAGMPLREVGFTGGEPFLNPAFLGMLAVSLDRGLFVLVLTNAMRPLMRPRIMQGLLALKPRHGSRLTFRVSLDHYSAHIHDAERGQGAFAKAIAGLTWLVENGFNVNVAGRMFKGESEAKLRAGYAALFRTVNIKIPANDSQRLVLLPEMALDVDVPEITTGCWAILGKTPDGIMCASSRMVIKRKGARAPAVVACTLLPYDPRFELGATLAEASNAIPLNHPYCAQFCVLGGGHCSG